MPEFAVAIPLASPRFTISSAGGIGERDFNATDAKRSLTGSVLRYTITVVVKQKPIPLPLGILMNSPSLVHGAMKTNRKPVLIARVSKFPKSFERRKVEISHRYRRPLSRQLAASITEVTKN